MKPSQLNGTYYAEEDRIMLRIKSIEQSEYRFWLTRFISQKILSVIEEISIKNIAAKNQMKALSQGVIEAIDEMQQKAVKSETDLTKPYESANKLPLGGHPQLITGVTFTASNTSLINLQFTLKNQISLNFELNFATLARIRLLLDELNKKANWELICQTEIHQDINSSNHVIH
jgi:hypothetical protein